MWVNYRGSLSIVYNDGEISIQENLHVKPTVFGGHSVYICPEIGISTDLGISTVHEVCVWSPYICRGRMVWGWLWATVYPVGLHRTTEGFPLVSSGSQYLQVHTEITYLLRLTRLRFCVCFNPFLLAWGTLSCYPVFV